MFKAVKRFIYLLQLDNYSLGRFWHVIVKKPFSAEQARQKIIWTPKLALIFSTALFLQLAASYLIARPLVAHEVYLGLFPIAFLFLFILLSFFHFLFLSLAVVALSPLDYSVKGFLAARAKNKIRVQKDLKIIGITGSYGKTTMKEILATVLSVKYKVLKTPDSVNTPVGISRLILKDLTADKEIFIVEMGAYRRGEIKALCEIATPDIAVLTGINEAHLERFGSIENTIKAKFEIVENAKSDALIVLNNDNFFVRENYKFHLGTRGVDFYKATERQLDYPAVPLLGEYI